ncbi:MAG TPA: hypothetical protein VFN11_10655 [Ktedonobacterales bacterium]|nr:hypothetical protein [Ktedonobacterales bacterium]
MIIFMSQAPILGVALPVLILVVLFEIFGEMVGLKTRINIAVLSVVGLLCLGAAGFLLLGDGYSNLGLVVYAAGVVLGTILALYALVTARRGQQRPWFVGILISVVVTLGVGIWIHAVLAQQDAGSAAVLTYSLAFVPALIALIYGLFAPDIPKPRGSMW